MSDHELRALERAWLESKSSADFERWNAALARAGQPVRCSSCRLALADLKARGSDEPVCMSCWQDALEHGHRQGLHNEAVLADCPLCGPACPACGKRPATVTVEYPGPADEVVHESVCESCAEAARFGWAIGNGL